MTSEINFTGRSTPRGIVAPMGPRVQIGITQGDSFQIRPGEPLHVCMPHAVGSGYSMAQMDKSQFIIRQTNAPAGAPRIAGQWFEIAMIPGVREGTREEVKLQSTATVPGATPFTVLTFTVVAGGRRFY